MSIRPEVNLLLKAGGLLLEYNESTAVIHRALASTARALTDQPCQVVVSFGSVAVFLAGENEALESVHELRYNAAVQARVHEILAQVRCGQLDAEAAVASLHSVEAATPRYPRWLVAIILGAAAVSLAGLLGADLVAAAVAGLATALGLLARNELARRNVSLLALPLTAAFIGAILGGLVIQLGWTGTPELVLVVPALMVVPGPHLINGLLDLIDNYIAMSMARLALAVGILLASAAGVVLGVELTLSDSISGNQAAGLEGLNLVTTMVLAGVVTCGFAVYFNAALRHLWLAILGGMTGHGLRFLALDAGCRLEVATFLGGLAVGIISAWIGISRKLPVAIVAFAGAVTMIPGLSLHRALIGAVRLARLAGAADATLLAETFGSAFHGSVVMCGLALGLILGTRAVQALAREGDCS